jgi:peptidoglycan/xylan/chitin deacetylase (PgdA/CDA1 family)
MPRRLLPALIALAGFSAPIARAQQVGTVRFSTSCAAATQSGFNRAVALLHSFAFSQASEGFQGVLRSDPRCAIAWWGIALSAWGNPFAAGIKPAAQISRGLDAVTRGRQLGAPTPREAGYLTAVARLYERADSLDQRTRLLAYRDAMAELVQRAPADTEAAIFHAVAVAIAADPADKSYAGQLAAGATLERLFAKLPDHPGLAHYLIHNYDVPPLAGRALSAAGRYGHIAPEISHALHMPSHTYTRVGYWRQSIEANIGSAEAAQRESSVAEELHADDYRTYAYLQTGQDSAAREIVAAVPGIAARLDPTAVGTGAPPSAGFFAIAAIPARYALERGAWTEAAVLDLRPSPYPFADAQTWFARALGAARLGDTAGGSRASAALESIRDKLSKAGERYWTEQVEIQRQVAMAWHAWAAGNRERGLSELRAAAEREAATEKNAITPGPLAPARELLGEMLLMAGRPVEALAAFEATLLKEPNRFRAVAGAARAAAAAGDQANARKYYAALLELGEAADRPGRPEQVEAAKMVGQPQGQAQGPPRVRPAWEWTNDTVQRVVNAVRAGRSLQPKQWPDGARVAVLLSFDVDNETLSLRTGEPSIGPLSQGEYGARVALKRVLDLLDRHRIPASFFIPAVSLMLHPEMADQIKAAGGGRHEFGVHGWIHETNTLVPGEVERDLVKRALEYLTQVTGTRPVGYRAPSWNFSPNTLAIVRELGFLYESSMMSDDRPYELLQNGQPTGVVELPVEWILDDAPLFNVQGANYASPREVAQVWIDEFDKAWEEGTLFLLTMHPHISGHRSRIVALELLLEHIRGKGKVWFATHRAAMEYVKREAGMR